MSRALLQQAWVALTQAVNNQGNHADYKDVADAIEVELAKPAMTPKFMQLLEQCILDGVVIGHKRAYKHNDAPSESDINMSIVHEVMTEIYEWFEFDVTLKEKE
jgi:hypothetical protein